MYKYTGYTMGNNSFAGYKTAHPKEMIVTPNKHLLLRSTQVAIIDDRPTSDGQVTIRFMLGNTLLNDTCKLEELEIDSETN